MLDKIILNKSLKKVNLQRTRNIKGVTARKRPNSYLKEITANELISSKKILHDYKMLRSVASNIDAFKGIARLYLLSEDTIFAEQIKIQIKNDKSIGEYILSDLMKLGCMTDSEMKELENRLKKPLNQVRDLNISQAKKEEILEDIINSPETYFKFSRSIDCEKNGFTPNQFSEILEEKGYSKQDINKLMSLIHLPSCCTTDEEWKFLMEARAEFPPITEGVKVIHEKDVTNYLNNKDYNSIFGYVADEGLYQNRFNRADLTLSILRLDYPDTSHFVNDTDKTYAIYFFGLEVGDKCIPPIQRELTVDSEGNVSINAPNNPNTGNAFTSARSNMVIPEYEISRDDPILLKDAQMILGYFDNQGEFHPQHAYMQDKWVSVEDFFALHEEIKRDTTERESIENQQTTELDITNQLPKSQPEAKSKDISFDDFDR